MASNSNAVFAVSPILGADLDSKSSTPAHRVLTPCFGSDGKEHIYVRASEALGSASTIKIKSLGSASSDSGSGGYNTNTTGGVALGQYFWAMKTAI